MVLLKENLLKSSTKGEPRWLKKPRVNLRLKQQKEQKKKFKRTESKKKQEDMLVLKLVANISDSFPALFQKLAEIPDFRILPQYSLTELLFAGIALHLFKVGSRNAFNNLREKRNFISNFCKAFKMKIPHLDTVDLAMRAVSNEEIEKVKTYLIKHLITKKTFYNYRIFGKYYNVAIDATGVMTIDEKNLNNFPNALYKTYRKGKEDEYRVYFINVLEAKLVTENGFCISLATEWIENPSEEYIKQDCEQKAFKRLSAKLKKSYPRLPICLTADGLYPNKTIFEACQKYNWVWIFTLKSGNLPSVWEEAERLKKLQLNNNKTLITSTVMKVRDRKSEKLQQVLKELLTKLDWINEIDYEGFSVNIVRGFELLDGEIIHTFVYLTSLSVTYENSKEIFNNGRLRFKIENEGFNIQKNHGYNMQHKFSQTSELAMKNYYSCMQIAHLINQFYENNIVLKARETFKNLWEFLRGMFVFETFCSDSISNFLKVKRQARFG